VAAFVSLAACSSTPEPPPALPPACPDAAVLQGADSIAEFAGADQRQSELRHLAVISSLVDSCVYDGSGVLMDLSFKLIAERGPRHGDGPLELRYFVATVAPGDRILEKQLLESEILFAAGEPNAGLAEDLTLRIPGVAPEEGGAYRVYVGFQLDDAQLERRSRPFFR
jgi:hypothetical protein